MIRRTSLLLSMTAGVFALCGLSTPARAASKDDSESLPDTINKVTSGSLRESLEALERLSQTRDLDQLRNWNVIDLLKDLAMSDNPRKARLAVRIMGDLVMSVDRKLKEEIRDPLVEVLKKTTLIPLVRVEAAHQLGRILEAGEYSDTKGISALVHAARPTPDAPEVAGAALIALGDIGDPKGKEPIRSALSAKDPLVQEAGLEALGMFLTGKNAKDMIDSSLSGLLMRLLGNATLSPDAKVRIIEAIGQAARNGAGKTEAENSLLRVLDNDDREVTVIATLKAIGFCGSARVVGPLVNTYEKFSNADMEKYPRADDVRAQVCATIGQLFDEWHRQHSLAPYSQASGLLTELLSRVMIKDNTDTVRKEAIVALGNLYDRRYDRRKAVATLIALMSTLQSDDMKGMVAESIEILTGRSFGKDVDRWERWFTKNERLLGPRGR